MYINGTFILPSSRKKDIYSFNTSPQVEKEEKKVDGGH